MTDIADMLKEQLKLQIDSFGADPTRMEPDERAEFIRWNVLSLEDELHEALGEVGWKPWATDRSIDHEAFMKEMIDAWHFFMNLMLVASGVEIAPDSDGTMEMEALAQWFSDRYMEKRRVNADRQADGYTGTDKCPECKRDRATTSVRASGECDPTGALDGPVEYCPCGHVYVA